MEILSCSGCQGNIKGWEKPRELLCDWFDLIVHFILKLNRHHCCFYFKVKWAVNFLVVEQKREECTIASEGRVFQRKISYKVKYEWFYIIYNP